MAAVASQPESVGTSGPSRMRRWRGLRPKNVAGLAFATVLFVIEAVIAAESMRGLTGFARLIGIHGVAALGVPVTLDGVSLVAALLALWAELAGEASGAYRVTLFVFTAASMAANYWHGRHDQHAGSGEAALYLGGMSLAVTWLFSLALRQIRREERRQAGRITERLPRFSAAHWLRYPGRTWLAWSLAVADGHGTARAALEAAAAVRASALPEVPADDELAKLPKAEAARLALAHCGGNVIKSVAFLQARGVQINRSYVHDCKRGVSGNRRRNRPVSAEVPVDEAAA